MADPEPERSSSSRSAREFTVSGRVQGVGFRWFTQRCARALDLQGWVRNSPDGSVEVLAEGHRGALDAFESDLRSGPPGSLVRGVEVREAAVTGRFSGFDVVY